MYLWGLRYVAITVKLLSACNSMFIYVHIKDGKNT